MAEYKITSKDFDRQKNELKRFAEQPATSTELGKFDTNGNFSDFLSSGFWGLANHKVTGEELNVLVTELQSCLAEINERERMVFKEFGQVYETFEALDKDYIQGILLGIESAKEASLQAKEASEEAKVAQKNIDATIETLILTVQKIQDFKNEINSYVHLNDVDLMWEKLNDIDMKIQSVARDYSHNLEDIIKKNSNKIFELENKVQAYETCLEESKSEKGIVKRKLNIAYIISGSAIGIAIIQLALTIAGVI